MNTIKFAPYNAFITEQHNVVQANVVHHVIGNKEYNIYNPCNYNVFIHNKCQNDCYFCINKQNDRSDISNEAYYAGLERDLDMLKNVHIEATITGGEPTLHPERFVETLKMLTKAGVKERTVSTTGYGLLNKYENKHLLQHLIDFDYIHNISISRMSIDDDLNNKILNGKNISNADLKSLAWYAEVNGVEARTSCNLMKQGVNSLDSILDYVNFQETNHIKSCLFRELVGIGYIAEQRVDIAPIQEQIKNDPRFVYDKTIGSPFYEIDIYIFTAQSGMQYIVKCYRDKKPEGNIIGSMSYNNGVTRIGFSGEIINE